MIIFYSEVDSGGRICAIQKLLFRELTMENLLFTIKKAPLIAWKAFLVLWALFLEFIGLVIKLLKFMSQFNPDGTVAMNKSFSDDGFETPAVNKVRTYQNGVDGPKRVPGTTFYH